MSILDTSGAKQATQEERFEKIRTLVHPGSGRASRELAGEVAALIREKEARGETAVLGLATGSTPVPFYRELIRLHREEGLGFGNVVTFNLDEYYGLARDHPESYHRFMHDQLFDHVDVPADQVHIPDGTVPMDGVYDWCLGYERAIEEAGGLDLQILGIGRTGHIGFNEPGSSADSITRMITLDRVTRQDAAADFRGIANVPRSAITMGVGSILRAERIVLMAWGSNKAGIVREAVEGEMTDRVSASFLQSHDNATFLVDAAAAERLTRFRYPWLVGPVDWDRRMKKRAVIWLSEKLNKPVLKLVDEDYNESGTGELLASTSEVAYEVNIDVFNQVQHTITGWPGGKPGADDSNRPERALPFPKKVLVVSPEPLDAFLGMGGTLERLVDQGHEVQFACLTSGNLRVSDVSAQKFASVVQEMADERHEPGWEQQKDYAESILGELRAKGDFGMDSELVRKLKGLILRGEARDAGAACGVTPDRQEFLGLPFYEKGRYRRFVLEEADVAAMASLLERVRPDSVFITGDAADPSSVQAICFRAFSRAWKGIEGEEWRTACRVWLYRGRDQPFEAHEVEMAVPMSPDQLESKGEAIRKFLSVSPEELGSPERNRAMAQNYDAIGMAEYEAIESFRRWTIQTSGA